MSNSGDKKKRHGAKLTENAVIDIRQNHKRTRGKDGQTTLEFAQKFGVSGGTINNALTRVTWKDI